MSAKYLACIRSIVRLVAILSSRIVRRSSGSVPSIAACSPPRRNGSSIVRVASSSASRPSRRARSARPTTVSTVADGVGPLAAQGGRDRLERGQDVLDRVPGDADADRADPDQQQRAGDHDRDRVAALEEHGPEDGDEGDADADEGCGIHHTLRGRMGTAGASGASVAVGGACAVESRRSLGWSSSSVVVVVGQVRHQLDAGLRLDLLGARQDRRAVLVDAADDLGHRLGDDVLGAVDQRQDRVRGTVDALDEVGVDPELSAAEARDNNHGSTRPWSPCCGRVAAEPIRGPV